MNITDIKIRKLMTEGRLKAIVSITLDNELALHDIKIIEGPSRLFVAMPSRRDDNGVFRDIVHPISAEGRATIENGILDYYNEYLAANESAGHDGLSAHSGGRNYFGEEGYPARSIPDKYAHLAAEYSPAPKQAPSQGYQPSYRPYSHQANHEQ